MKHIPDAVWEIVRARFERMPPHLRLVVGGFGQALKKEEILEHIEKRDEIGKLIVETQLEYLKSFKDEAESYEKIFNKT